MTKKDFSQQLVSLVQNAIEFDGKEWEEIADDVEAFLNVLQPVNREAFAKWGFPEQRSTPEECWD